jgi:hypothetical protein
MMVKCRVEEEDKAVQTTRWSAQPSDLPYTFLTVGSATARAIEHTLLSTIMSCNSCSAFVNLLIWGRLWLLQSWWHICPKSAALVIT